MLCIYRSRIYCSAATSFLWYQLIRSMQHGLAGTRPVKSISFFRHDSAMLPEWGKKVYRKWSNIFWLIQIVPIFLNKSFVQIKKWLQYIQAPIIYVLYFMVVRECLEDYSKRNKKRSRRSIKKIRKTEHFFFWEESLQYYQKKFKKFCSIFKGKKAKKSWGSPERYNE